MDSKVTDSEVRPGRRAEHAVAAVSVISGGPLAEEAGVGALTIGGFVREVAARFGPREAAVLHGPAGAERWTYDELLSRSFEVARALIAAGVGKGSRVGILQTNTPQFLASLFGTALAGGVATTISTFFTPAELETVLKMGCCSVLLMERKVLNKDFQAILGDVDPIIPESQPGLIASPTLPYLRHAVVIGGAAKGGFESWEEFLKRGEGVSDELVVATADAVTLADPAVLFFSSGSTGKPKGILSAHRGVCLQLWRWRQWYGLDEGPRTWAANGFFWSGNFAMALGGTLSAGGSLILQRWFEAEEALRLFEDERVSMVIAWPHQWAQLAESPGFAKADLSAIRYIEATSPVAQHPTVEVRWRPPSNSYGSTETFTLITAPPPDDDGSVVHHGHPTAGSTIKIVDPISGEPLPYGERGEIAVKGPTLMLGYLGTPLDETLDSQGFLRTGDSGHLDGEGRLVWEGRLNDIIKTGGANISPLEVDEVIRLHRGVKIVRTVGVPDALLGELVVACVIPVANGKLTEAEIQAFARQKLASYKSPRRVLFFEDGDFSITGSAKIKLDDLRKMAAERLANEAS